MAAVIDCRNCATPLPAGARFCNGCGIDVTDPGATVVSRPRDPMAELQDRLTRTLSGRYEVRKLLGAGGMAAVFLADEIGLDRPVAIKVLPPELSRDEGLVARFQREAKTAAKLDHPHIIPIHRVESEAGLHYFVMKYVPGRSLESMLQGHEPLPIDLATRILREAAMALGHAHARGVVHRDVKPANIMLDHDERVVLTDFGISKAGETSSLTQTGMIIGTPHYMAPEQAIGSPQVDGRADQYSLGVVAYEMLARQCPFTGESAHTILYRHIHETPTPITELRPDVPQHLAEAVGIAMAKDPGDRFAKMEEFARALGGDRTAAAARPSISTAPMGVARQSGQPARTRRMSAGARPAAAPRKSRLGTVVGSLAVVLAAVAGGWYILQGGATSPTHIAGSEMVETPSIAADPAPIPPSVPPATPSDSLADSLPLRVSDSPATADSAPPAEAPASRTTPRSSTGKTRTNRPPTRSLAERPEQPQTATLTIDCQPYAMLFIDDVEIGDTPIANHVLQVGRSYRVRLERDGYKPKRETITVSGPNPIRRNYVLDPGEPQ